MRSLRAQPAQAGALSKLAAVRWELEPPTTEEETAVFLEMIEVASRMAPRVPRVQLRLGELLLKMGRSVGARISVSGLNNPTIHQILHDIFIRCRNESSLIECVLQ